MRRFYVDHLGVDIAISLLVLHMLWLGEVLSWWLVDYRAFYQPILYLSAMLCGPSLLGALLLPTVLALPPYRALRHSRAASQVWMAFLLCPVLGVFGGVLSGVSEALQYDFVGVWSLVFFVATWGVLSFVRCLVLTFHLVWRFMDTPPSEE